VIRNHVFSEIHRQSFAPIDPCLPAAAKLDIIQPEEDTPPAVQVKGTSLQEE